MRSWIGRFIRPALRLGARSILLGNRSLDTGPVPLNWLNVSTEFLTVTTEKLQITAINVPVRFTATFVTDNLFSVSAVVCGNTAGDGAITTSLGGTSASTFMVPPNAYVWFVCSAGSAVTNRQVRVQNLAPPASNFDSFLVTLGAVPPP
jgi:hypothetical protein